MDTRQPARLRGPGWLMLAGLTVLAIDTGLTAWGMHRDARWNATVLGRCRSGYFPYDLPRLPENGWIGVVTLCTIGPAVVITLVGATRLSRRSHHGGGIVAAAVLTAVAAVVACWLLMVGLLMIEPRTSSTGTDGSGLPCPEG